MRAVVGCKARPLLDELLAHSLLAFNAVLFLLRDGWITEGYAALLGNSLTHRLDIELRHAVAARDQRDELHAQCQHLGQNHDTLHRK